MYHDSNTKVFNMLYFCSVFSDAVIDEEKEFSANNSNGKGSNGYCAIQ